METLEKKVDSDVNSAGENLKLFAFGVREGLAETLFGLPESPRSAQTPPNKSYNLGHTFGLNAPAVITLAIFAGAAGYLALYNQNI